MKILLISLIFITCILNLCHSRGEFLKLAAGLARTDLVQNKACDYCRGFFNFLQDSTKSRTALNTINFIVNFACKIKMNDDNVCRKVKDLFADEMIKGVIARKLNPNYICTSVIPICQKGKYYTELNADDYAREILKDLPLNKNNSDIDKQQSDRTKNSTINNKNIKILHLTDVHIDLEYEEVRILFITIFILGIKWKL
jgi:hypothetical protein